jgi:anaerobic selenocysteine-containing dehydrogenase
MIRHKGQPGFSRISWDAAINVITEAIHNTAPQQMGFFATSRGLTNEVYYVFQKLARVLGTNNVDLCSRLCHAASVSGLKDTLGVGAPTCSLSDFIGTQLLVIFGSDLANNQPVTTKYMHYAKKQGTRIVVVNPMREYGLRVLVPSVASSALFGTKLMDDFFQVRVGGDIAFINGAIKALLVLNRLDREFIAKHTSVADEPAALEAQSWEMLEQRSAHTAGGAVRSALRPARSAVLVYSMGLTQHEFGVENVKAIVNLALSRACSDARSAASCPSAVTAASKGRRMRGRTGQVPRRISR